MDNCAGAHWAGLFGHVKVAISQAPVPDGGFGLREREHLGVGGGVFEQLYLIEGARDYFSGANDHTANRHLVSFVRFRGQPQRFRHEIGVALRFDHHSRCTRRKPVATGLPNASSKLRINEVKYVTMNRVFSILTVVWLLTGPAGAASEQAIVDRSAQILRDFRAMPERQIPRSILRRARGLAVLSVIKAGFIFSGNSADGKLVEIIELKDHPFYVASQFHPEFHSKPHQPHPLFKGFITAAHARMHQKPQ